MGCGPKIGGVLGDVIISAMQTPIHQKRPNFRIPYLRSSKCRPLHSAARGACPFCPTPSCRHWKSFGEVYLTTQNGVHRQSVSIAVMVIVYRLCWCWDSHFETSCRRFHCSSIVVTWTQADSSLDDSLTSLLKHRTSDITTV